MDILEKFFSIFSEGANDAQYRKEVNDLIEKIKSNFSSLSEKDIDAKIANNGAPIAQFNVGKLVGDEKHNKLWLRFDAVNEEDHVARKGSFAPSSDHKYAVVMINAEVPGNVFEKFKNNPDLWATVIKKKGNVLMGRVVSTLRHELIHYWDFSRIGNKRNIDVFKKSGKNSMSNKEKQGLSPADREKRWSKYFNDPLEQNAFIQQGLSRMEDYLKNVSSWEDAKHILGSDANELYRKIVQLLPRDLFKRMEEKNKSKLKKRVAQLWNDTKKRLEGGE